MKPRSGSVGATMPRGAKLSKRSFGNLFWIATAGGHCDLNDFFGDDFRDRIIAINKIGASAAQTCTPCSASRPGPAAVLRKKAIDRYGVPPPLPRCREPYAHFVSE